MYVVSHHVEIEPSGMPGLTKVTAGCSLCNGKTDILIEDIWCDKWFNSKCKVEELPDLSEAQKQILSSSICIECCELIFHNGESYVN